MASMTRKGQVYSVGNYLMTGKVFGKGHFARVEEATHRIIGRKVAIKIIDLTLIKEEYARRNLHREPRVMAKLRHPCIAALYETMMHGPRLYVVMEAAGGGDLCAHVLAHGGRARAAHAHAPRGLPEPRARSLAAQLVSAVRHMHARGVVHRDLKMENIMLDSTKQFIKIVDFGLSNMWSGGSALRTPCGSLEYAAPELFVDGRRYGPEVDLWSVGVIVYGMVLGSLPFTGGEREAGGERALLRAAIARGLTRRQRAMLQALSPDCKAFIQNLLEPNVELRMKIEEAARHHWIKRPGMKMKTHPLPAPEPKLNREIYKQISDLSGQTVIEVISQIKAEPFGSLAGMYNIKSHLHQMQVNSGAELLWSAAPQPRPESPPRYAAPEPPRTAPPEPPRPAHPLAFADYRAPAGKSSQPQMNQPKFTQVCGNSFGPMSSGCPGLPPGTPNSPALAAGAGGGAGSGAGGGAGGVRRTSGARAALAHGDGLHRRLPCIEEHAHAHTHAHDDYSEDKRAAMRRRRAAAERLHSCPERAPDARREFYRRAGDASPSWRASGCAGATSTGPAPRILLQTHATTIKRASLGNIVSPHSSSNSHCKSDRAMPVGWYATKASIVKESSHFQRLRRTAPMK